ncbi:hypothetical protein PV05_06954 [Exophiala xenobiotica]|uniref:Uncharacterized protein n=1 Tax=Exophiala xenobiotica TaxID=348802 RepID=A0A0D2EIY2_9EURO|nr:uncharacterized protein PV05_06954 [Exophiala xenobiotica]KIW54605.1 hypothetical protein PV05_06954 [Exophiala xenobiotica]
MRRARLLGKERSIVTEKALKCKGMVSVRLEVLSFPEIKTKDPTKLKNNVERLKKAFWDEGCWRLPLPNHIPAQIDKQSLDAAIRHSQRSSEELFVGPRDEYPELEFPPGYQLMCLDGQSRALAAAKVLPLADRRWIVDLYAADLTEELRTILVEEYSNEDRPHPGEIYRKLRLYHLQRDLRIDNWWFEKRCWARLSPHGRRNVKQLLRHREITAACDALLDVVGLWSGWRTSTWHKILAMGVDECVLCYLDFMKDFWYESVGEERNAMQKVDENSVKDLECTAPGACRADARNLYGKLKAGKIFGAFNDQDREKIWAEVCRRTKDRLIPSFFTFFEDLNWLTGPANCVKRLIPISSDDTILYALEQHVFTGANQRTGQCLIQKPDHTFVSKSGTEADQMNLGVLQLFLIAMRNHLDMPAEPKKKNLLAKPRPKRANPEVLHEFAAHAHKLGFESDEIRELMELRTSSRAPQQESVSSGPEESDPPIRRCGIPLSCHHEQDKPCLFLEPLYAVRSEEFEEMTSSFVRRSVILAFFEKPTSLCLSEVTSHPSEPTADRGTIGQEPSARRAQPNRQGLEQRHIDQHSGPRNTQDPLQQGLQAGNTVGEAENLSATQLDQQIVTREGQVESEWVSDIEMLDETEAVQHNARRDRQENGRIQKKNARRSNKQRKTSKKKGAVSARKRQDISDVGAMLLKVAEESSLLSKQQEVQKQLESPSRTTQINPEGLTEGNIPMPLQNQSSTPDHNEIMELGQPTATERQSEDQDMVQTVTENVVHEITTSDIPTLQGEVTTRKTGSPAEVEGRREAQEQQTTAQTFREPDERQLMERTQDGREGREGQHVDQGEQRATEKEQGQEATSERINEAQTTPPREMAHTEDSAATDQILLDEAEQAWADDQMRRDREESLFCSESLSPIDELTNVELTAPKRGIETGPPEWTPGGYGSVNDLEEALPRSTTDQQHEPMPTQQANVRTEEVERISRAEMRDSAGRETIPVFPQPETLERGQEKLEELRGCVSHDHEIYGGEVEPQQGSQKRPSLDPGRAIEDPSLLQDLSSSSGMREVDLKRDTRIDFGRVEELEDLQRAWDGVRDVEEPVALEAEGFQEVQEELGSDEQARYEPLPNEGDRARLENTERNMLDDRLREQENEERLESQRRKQAAKEEGQRWERLARQERARQLKSEKTELSVEQKMAKNLARDRQERSVKEDEGMRRKRTTQIDFGRLGEVDERPRPRESAGKHPIRETETVRGLGEIIMLDSDVIATTSQQPPDPPHLSTETPDLQKIRIHLKMSDGRLAGGDWKSLPSHDVDPSEPADFMRFLRKFTRKDAENPWNVFAGSHMITPLTKFEDIVKGGNNTLYITREGVIDTSLHPDSPAGKRVRS